MVFPRTGLRVCVDHGQERSLLLCVCVRDLVLRLKVDGFRLESGVSWDGQVRVGGWLTHFI